MDHLIELFKHLINPEWIIAHGGLYLLLLIVFAETGLFVGFFLPGDSLLFVAGFYGESLCNSFYDAPLVAIITMVCIAAIIGNMVGFWFGRKSGPLLFRRKDTFFFKQKHLYQAKLLYDKHGGGAIFLARFMPIVRTFAPIVAGIVGMEFRKFMFYNVISSIAWVFSMMLAGHYLGKTFPGLKNHLELIVLILIIITTLPVIIKLFFGKAKNLHPTDVSE